MGLKTSIALGSLLASLGVTYSLARYLLARTPIERQEALLQLQDSAYGVIAFVAVLAYYLNLGEVVNRLCEALGIEAYNALNVEDVVRHAASVYETLWLTIVNNLRVLYSTMIALQMNPITTPLGIYMSHATQYYQWVAHTALHEAWLLATLSKACLYVLTIGGLGAALLTHERLRPIGSALTSLAIVLPTSMTVFSRWVELYVLPQIPVIKGLELSDIAAIGQALLNAIMGGFEVARVLQEFCVYSALTLALTGALTGGISYLISRVYHSISY